MKSVLHCKVSTAFLISIVAVTFAGGAVTATQTERVIYALKGFPNGNSPYGRMAVDRAGNLYGTATIGGQNNEGAIFQLTPPATKSGAWTESELYSFNLGNGGSLPQASLILDHKGAIYSVTELGGQFGNGTVFELTPPAREGGAWTETVLYGFTGFGDGGIPLGGLTFNESGALFGTTGGGGNLSVCLYGCGTVFNLIPPDTQGGAWTEKILHKFNASDGQQPEGELIRDKAGNLYGTTEVGGYGCGNVYELSPPDAKGGRWKETVLYNFTCSSDGQWPVAGLVNDPEGNLYGTTFRGGNLSACQATGGGCGVVFQLTHPAMKGGAWSETVIYTFTGGSDGAQPLGALTRDGAGNLYGTTYIGGDLNCFGVSGTGCGTVFKLTPPSIQGGPWTQTTLHIFTGGQDGEDPFCGLIFGKGHALYGTTIKGGSTGGYGTVYAVVP